MRWYQTMKEGGVEKGICYTGAIQGMGAVSLPND